MIDLLREATPDRVKGIHDAAIRYYARDDGTASRAEELYHRLCRGDRREEIDGRWRPDAEPLLRPSRDELPDSAKAYLAAKTEGRASGGFEAVSLGDDYWRTADRVTWERKTARWVGDLIRQDRYEDALSAVRVRRERSPTSPLFLLEARVLKSLGRWDEARDVLVRAEQAWPEGEDPVGRLSILLLLARVWVRQNRPSDAEAALGTARQLLAHVSGPEAEPLALDEAALSAGLARGTARAEEVDRLLRARIAQSADRVILAAPDAARRAAAEVLRTDPGAAPRLIRLVGLEDPDPIQMDTLARHLEALGRPPSTAPQTWRAWLGGPSSREAFAEAVVLLGRAQPAATELTGLVIDLLRGSEEAASRRAAKERASNLGALTGDELRQVVEAIASAFTAADLTHLLRSSMATAFHSIVPDGTLQQQVFSLVEWAQSRERLDELLTAAEQAAPDNSALRQIAARYRSQRVAPPSAAAFQLPNTQGIQFALLLADLFQTEEDLREWEIRHFGPAAPGGASSGPDGGLDSAGATGYASMVQTAERLIDRANREGWAGRLLATARRSFPTCVGLYRFAEDFGLTAATADQDRTFRDSIPYMDIKTVRERLGAVERQVCQIDTPDGRGTGFLVAPGIVVTSWSVLRGAIEGRYPPSAVTVRFDAQRLSDGTEIHPGEVHTLAADRWQVATEPLPTPAAGATADRRFLAIRLTGRPGDDRFADRTRGWVPLPQADAPADPSGDLTYLVHCSSTRPLVLTALRGSAPGSLPLPPSVGARGASELESTAAGSPVFNFTELACVAVHHGPAPTESGGSLATPLRVVRDLLASAGVLSPLPDHPTGGLPATSDRPLARLTALVASAYDRPALENLVRLQLTANLNDYAPRDLPDRDTISYFLTRLDQAGRLIEFVRAFKADVPGRADVQQFCEAFLAHPPSLTTTGPGKVTHIPIPARDKVIRFNERFRRCGDEMRSLNGYKELHDVLHKVQGTLEPLRQAAGRFRAQPATPGELLGIREGLLQLVQSARKAARKLSDPEDVADWLGAFENAVADLDVAIRTPDPKILDRVQEVLVGLSAKLPEVNEELVKASKRAGVDGLTSLIDGILADLSALGVVPTTLAAEIRVRLWQFRRSCASLPDLRVDHNRCQQVDNALSLAATLPELTSDRVGGWADVKRQILDLCDRRRGNPLAARTRTSVDEFEAARDALTATDAFTTLLIQFRALFNRTDEELLEVTDDLLREAAHLDAVLRSLTDAPDA
jgi:hypothetical protein